MNRLFRRLPAANNLWRRSLCGIGVEQSTKSLSFIGAGQMAEALIRAVLKQDYVKTENILVHDVNKERLDYIQKKYGVAISSDINSVVNNDLVILACKPQNAQTVADSLRGPPKGTILSILAGKPVEDLKKIFKTQNVVRTMPNTPATVGEGMTVWYAANEVPEDIVQMTKDILRCAGEEIKVTDEALIDMATAISGTGPAYVFLTVEAMVDAAVHMGVPRSMATKLVNKTVKGSVTYAQNSGHSVSTLRNNVTSPGGTTASALYELEKGGYRTVMANAMWACYRRALELGGESSNVGPGRAKDGQH